MLFSPREVGARWSVLSSASLSVSLSQGCPIPKMQVLCIPAPTRAGRLGNSDVPRRLAPVGPITAQDSRFHQLSAGTIHQPAVISPHRPSPAAGSADHGGSETPKTRWKMTLTHGKLGDSTPSCLACMGACAVGRLSTAAPGFVVC
eukprot:gene12249-biopygen21463